MTNGTGTHIFPQRIVFFDGVCNLCNGYVRSLIRIDRRERLKFASLQSELAREMLERPAEEPLNSIVYWNDGHVSERSNAVIAIMNDIGGGWRLVNIFRILPRVLRDALYDFVARNRYRWFGKMDECPIPTEKDRARMLDGTVTLVSET